MEQSTIKAGTAFLILLQFIGQASAGSNEFTFFGQSSNSELFPCHVDICNSITTIPQFCSEDQKRCKDCADVITWCLEPRMPPECKQFCMESIGKEYHKLEEEKPCEGQMIPQLKHGTSDGNHSAAATYKQGSMVNFTCEIGFKLSGSSSMCGPFGQWTSAPVCQATICVLPKMNGLTIQPVAAQYSLSTRVNVTCNGNKRSVVLTCSPSGTWDLPIPSCDNATVCVLPKMNGLTIQPVAAQYSVSTRVNVTCNGNKRSVVLTCSPSGTWDLPIPSCDNDEHWNIWIVLTFIFGVLLLMATVGIMVLIIKNWGRKKHNDIMDGFDHVEESLLNNQENNPGAGDMTDCQTKNSGETTPASSKNLPDDLPDDILDGDTARKHLSSSSENDESSATGNSIMPVSEPKPNNLMKPSGALEKFGVKPVDDETKNHTDAGIHQTFSKQPQVETTIELNKKAFCTSVTRKQGPDPVPPSIEKRNICKACHTCLENGNHTIKETSNI